MTLKITGEGEIGTLSGARGNLYVRIHVKDDPLFTRERDDILCDVDAPFAMAALGGTLEVPTLEGKARLTIPAGTAAGKIFRLRGKGFPSLNGYGHGDQLVRVNIQVPTHLSEKEKRLLEEFAKLRGDAAEPRKSFFDFLR
jgi:molecular chaperone DnaJ